MYNLAIIKCTSPPLLAPRLNIFKRKFTTPPGSNPGPAEPEADMLPSEPARQAPVHMYCYLNRMTIHNPFPNSFITFTLDIHHNTDRLFAAILNVLALVFMDNKLFVKIIFHFCSATDRPKPTYGNERLL